MKRWIAWILALVLLVGCGSMGLSVQASAADDWKRPAKITLGGGHAAEPGEEAEESAESMDKESVPELELARGVISGKTYENTSLGIACTLPDGWTFYTDEEIAELSGFAYESIKDETLSALLEQSQTCWDMYAISETGAEMVGVQIESIGAEYGSFLSEGAYVDIAMGMLDGSLEDLGLSEGTMEKSSIDFLGEERVALRVDGMVQNILELHQAQVCMKVGNYMLIVLLQTMPEDETDRLAQMFYAPGEAPAEPEAPAAEEPAEGADKPRTASIRRPTAAEPEADPAEPAVEPVPFIEVMGSVGSYAYVDATGVSGVVYEENGKNYYAVEDVNYLYIVCMSDDQLAQMGEQQVYWDRTENTDNPAEFRIAGVMGVISPEGREAFKTFFELDDEGFDYYFGDDCMDATQTP